MDRRTRQGRTGLAAAVGAVCVMFVLPAARPIGDSAPGVVQLDGQAAYVPRRTWDGQPDLQGTWQAVNTAAWDIEDHGGARDVPAGRGVVVGGPLPYRPEAQVTRDANRADRATRDPETRCFLPGVPRITYMPFPFRIVQSASQVTLFYEYLHATRNIFLNSSHPKGPIEWWMGDSRGQWEGNTLVVDVVHFTSQTWFDRAGNFHSADLHVVERYTPTGPQHLQYDARIEDPNVFTRPWTMRMPLYRRQEADLELLEYECALYQLERELTR